MSRGETLEADLTWTGERFEPGVQIRVGEDGRIVDCGALGASEVRRLVRRALLPGFVNAHSHAFQRGLRGRGESFPEKAGSFWTWREAMYELVSTVDTEHLHDLCSRAFAEMRTAGMTSVGEFHYLHHDDADARDGRFDEVVLAAAEDAGIRIVLLQAYYRTGSIGRPLSGAQARFAADDVPTYWHRMDASAASLRSSLQSLGAVAHSIRAVPLEDLIALSRESRSREMVLHMHVEEQRREIEECRRALGRGPMKLLLDEIELGPRFTAVHCTHTHREHLERFARSGAHLCLCPLTEANLGDGLCELDVFLQAGGSLAFGSDSNARISMIEEMRWAEYGQRLRLESRGVCRDRRGRVAPGLLQAATAGGAASLGLRTGRIAPGHEADFATLDLDHPDLEGATSETLPEQMVFGAGDGLVAETSVAGRWSPARPPRA